VSSSYVRTQITNFVGTDLASETLVDLTGVYDELQDVLNAVGVSYEDSWLGMQFIGNEELPINVGADNSQGCYREYGAVYLHIVAMATIGCHTGILSRSETIRNAFRGQRINDIIIENVSPPNFELGATLDFEGGWVSASVVVSYYRDYNL
jgi:nitrous oxidase accessory protein NosD